MQDTKETFELLKNYINQLTIGLLLFNTEKKLIAWNSQITNILEIEPEDLKKGSFGRIENQISELLNSELLTEKDLVGLSKPYKAKKIIAPDQNMIFIISETQQETVGEMSHELRRPITNIKTLTESLLMGAINEPEIAKKFLQNINNEVDRLTKLVNELINLSKIRAGRLSQAKKKLNLKPKVEDAIKLLQSIAEKNKTTIINEVDMNYEIFADSDQIDHVIQNLIENAIRYSNEGSKVTIRPGPEKGSFQVDDTGIGITENDIPKIFERFYRIDRTRVKNSSGLGLSIVKNIVDLHGGKIEVKSKLGAGSSFIIYLPLG